MTPDLLSTDKTVDWPEGLGRTDTHWRRGGKAYGPFPTPVVVDVWWPISDPNPPGSLWEDDR